MPKRIPDDERERIIAALKTGKSSHQLAKEFGRSQQSISRIARSVGHKWAQANADHAREINAKYVAERRAQLRDQLILNAARLADQQFAPTIAYNFGGKDNTYAERQVPEPSFRDKKDISAAINVLIRTVNEIDKADATLHDTGLLDELDREIDKNADEYADRAEG